MHDSSAIAKLTVALQQEDPATTPDGDFRQIFSRISARIASGKPKAETDAIGSDAPVEAQLIAAREALSKAHVSLVQIGLELETERHARQAAEEKARAEQQARREALQLLEHTVQPLRELKAAAAEHEQSAEQQTLAYAVLENHYRAVEAQLAETQETLAREMQVASDMRRRADDEQRLMSEQYTQIQAELEARCNAVDAQLQHTEAALAHAMDAAAEIRLQMDTERIARQDAEAEAQAARAAREEAEARVHAERAAREKAEAQAESDRIARAEAEAHVQRERNAREGTEHALLQVQHALNEQRERAEQEARAHAALIAQQKSIDAALAERHVALSRSAAATAELERLVETERLARQEAENRVQTERDAREVAQSALIEVTYQLNEQRARTEDHARASANATAKDRALEAQLKEAETALARANYVAQKHAERHAQLAADLDTQRRAREAAEKKLELERRARDEVEQALAQTQSGFFSKLLRGNR